MPKYAPLPPVSIDPRNEAELVRQAAQLVYEASNRTLNDFSAGNPLAVLLEGQAFAQGEFLFWANQLPDKILLEWIGPFLGAMRRLGTPSTASLTIRIDPRNIATTIPAGTSFTTNPQITNGQSYEFVSYTDLTIPAGETVGETLVYSKFVGSQYNVASGSITGASSLGGITLRATNTSPSVGGSDVETYQQVQERFFTLIRRRNPVSETDWQDFFTDLYGDGTITSVQPNRTSQYNYNYTSDYAQSNGQVSFFVLGPNGVELSADQLKLGQNAVNFSTPVENQGHLFPITLSQAQYDLTVEVDPNGTFGQNYKQSSLNFRNLLFATLQPGNVFPATVNPTVSDVDAAFYSNFTTNYRFLDPHIVKSVAYNTPTGLSPASATYTQIYNFEPTEYLLNQNNLIRLDSPNPVFYPVLTGFTPYSTDKFDQTIYGNLALRQIRALTAGYFELGDVVYYDGLENPLQQGLHVVLENVTISSQFTVLQAIAANKISAVKTYSSWVVGNNYQYSIGPTIDPQIVQYDYLDGDFIPATPSNVPLNNRPGSLVWLVAQNFTLQASTNDITGAQAAFKIGSPVTPAPLIPGNSYAAGTWVFTPQIASGPDQEIDPYFYYVDITKGAMEKYAYVVNPFTYNPNSQKISDYFDSLVESGVIQEEVVQDGNGGLPIYKYRARFEAGQYLEYKESTLSSPSYYIAAKYFTPDSADASKLVADGSVINLAPTPELSAQFETELRNGFSGKISKLALVAGGSGYVDGTYSNVPLTGGYGTLAKATLTVSGGVVVNAIIDPSFRGQKYRVDDSLSASNTNLGGSGSGLVLKVLSIYPPDDNPLQTPVRMFTFFKGDTTFFRTGNDIVSYIATSSVTPLFNFDIYYNNGVFVESSSHPELSTSYENSIPFFNPVYTNFAEDTILAEDGRNFYRTMRAFTPATTTVSWTDTQTANTCRYEEYAGNLLRYVDQYVCEEPILSQYGKETSAIKLGICRINIVPKNYQKQALSFVWENTETLSTDPELSWYNGSPFAQSPPNYNGGTLAL